jgi:hypothetical protein
MNRPWWQLHRLAIGDDKNSLRLSSCLLWFWLRAEGRLALRLCSLRLWLWLRTLLCYLGKQVAKPEEIEQPMERSLEFLRDAGYHCGGTFQ